MGCRKYNGRQWTDDLDGQTYLPEELERMVFVFDGVAYEIDLTDENAEGFREAMAAYVGAARPTTKSAVLATLPRKKRHLSVVPSPDPAPEPQGSDQNAPSEEKGESTETRTEPEGTQVPEAAPKPSDFSPLPEPVKPALRSVPTPEPSVPEAWAPYRPERNDDAADRRLKARQWAGAMGSELPNNMVTAEVLARWEGFYRERRWLMQ